MLIRKTSKNQVVIPKALIKQAGLDEGQIPFFDASYRNGGFFLRPVRQEAVGNKEELFRLLDRFERRSRALGLTKADVAHEIRAYRKERRSSRKAP